MVEQSTGLSEEEGRAIAHFITGKTVGVASVRPIGYCSSPPATMLLSDSDWNGWGRGPENSRYQQMPGLTAAHVPKLKLKWAFGFPDQSTAASQPSVVGERVFVGSSGGAVYSLQAATGCIWWTYAADADVRTAITIGKLPSGKWAAFFGDVHAWVHAVDAETGEPLWKVKLDDHPVARITGSATLSDGRLYVPMSSTEESRSFDPAYSCCTFRGSVSALDAQTGRLIWKSYTITDPPRSYSVGRGGMDLRGPAGAAVWSSPTVDRERKMVFVATGNSYTGVSVSTSDAIMAFDLDSGKLAWSAQLQPDDNFILGCPFHPNCPPEQGPDFDFGAPPMLQTLADGKRILIASQKSGMVYALDPDQRGKTLWQTRVGDGGALGGIVWGPAADARFVYVAVSDRTLGKAGAAGLYALDPATGRKKWETPAPPASGNPAQSAAVTVMPGVVFSGSVNGHFRAYSSANGEIIWDFDTNRPYQAVNGVPARGGSLDGPGAVIAHGMVFTNSGNAGFSGAPGNVLLAFSVGEK